MPGPKLPKTSGGRSSKKSESARLHTQWPNTQCLAANMEKKCYQCNTLWKNILIEARHTDPCQNMNLSTLLGHAYLLEEHIQTDAQLFTDSTSETQSTELRDLLSFYKLQEINHHQLKFSGSLISFLLDSRQNRYSVLPSYEAEESIMSASTESSPAQTNQPKVAKSNQWVNKMDIHTLTNIIAAQLKHDDVSNPVPTTDISSLTTPPARSQHSQRIRFNLICHQGASSDQTTLALFKSFATTLRCADVSVTFLPWAASKQHYSSLHNIKQIQELEGKCLYQFFKSYYQRQNYSISGFFHISSTLPLIEIKALPSVEE